MRSNLSRQDEIYGKHICNKTASESGLPRNNFHFLFHLLFYHIFEKEYLKGRVKIKWGKVLECTSIWHKLCLLLMQLHNSFLKGYYMYYAFQPCTGFLSPFYFLRFPLSKVFVSESFMAYLLPCDSSNSTRVISLIQ